MLSNFRKPLLILAIISANVVAQEGPGEPLYLTPLIEEGDIGLAQEAALAIRSPPVISYSGLITVNKEYNSNIFFWFFPSEESYGDDFYNNDIPVILWSDGGPGMSCIFSIYDGSGPFIGNATTQNYTFNDHSWHKKYHMIYMDNPVQVGFSFTDKEEGLITSDADAAKDIYEFLTQFFKLFPHLQRNPFYNAGVSYGATFAIHTAHLIHQRNLETPEVYINLTGLIVDSPWIDPNSQSFYADQLHAFGLINEVEKERMREKEHQLQSLLNEEKYAEGMGVWAELTQMTAPTLTGYTALYDTYNDQLDLLRANMTDFITQNLVRRLLHVGNLNFSFVNLEQQGRMSGTFMKSSKTEMDALLKSGYRFMIYVGNMDILTGHVGIETMMRTVEWDGANNLINGTKSIHKMEGNKIAGYKTSVLDDRVEYVIIRNAGHGCAYEQPDSVLEFVKMFLSSESKKE